MFFIVIAIGRVNCQTAPLVRVCSNRPRGWTDNVATRVPVHDLASRGPSAPNRTDRRTNTGLSRNIDRVSVALRDKNWVYLFVGHLRVNLKVLPSNFFYVVWNFVSCDGPLPDGMVHPAVADPNPAVGINITLCSSDRIVAPARPGPNGV